MKTVLKSHTEIAHVFAQRQQTSARANNIFMEKSYAWSEDYADQIYSYGHHYMIANYFRGKDGSLAVMINDTGYSASTAKHINIVLMATRQYKQFYLCRSDANKVLLELEYLANKLQSARKPEIYINGAERLFKDYCKFVEFVGGKVDAKINSLISVFRGADYKEYLNKKEQEIKREEKRKRLKEKRAAKIAIDKFLSYEINCIYSKTDEDYIRISRDQSRVETSQGVKVDIKKAVALYMLIKAGKDIKGYNIDGYTVISLNGVLKIGCHNINKTNMIDIGEKVLNLINQ